MSDQPIGNLCDFLAAKDADQDRSPGISSSNCSFCRSAKQPATITPVRPYFFKCSISSMAENDSSRARSMNPQVLTMTKSAPAGSDTSGSRPSAAGRASARYPRGSSGNRGSRRHRFPCKLRESSLFRKVRAPEVPCKPLTISQRFGGGKGRLSLRQGHRIIQVPQQVVDKERFGNDRRDAYGLGEVVVLASDKVQQSDDRGGAMALDDAL